MATALLLEVRESCGVPITSVANTAEFGVRGAAAGAGPRLTYLPRVQRLAGIRSTGYGRVCSQELIDSPVENIRVPVYAPAAERTWRRQNARIDHAAQRSERHGQHFSGFLERHGLKVCHRHQLLFHGVLNVDGR